MNHIAKNQNANEIIINLACNAVENNNLAKCIELKRKYKLSMRLLKSLNIELWLKVRAMANSDSNNWGTNTAGKVSQRHLEFDTLTLKNKAKWLLSGIMQKTKGLKFNISQMKLTIDSCTREDLLKCFNNSNYNTDKLLQLVGRKASKYNR